MLSYVRIIRNDLGHLLVQLLDTSTKIGLRFTPLEYIKVMSRELDKVIVGCTFAEQGSMLTQLMYSQELFTNISVKEIFNGDSHSTSQGEVECQFIQYHQGSLVLVFTDGSIDGGPVGCGACSAVLFPLSISEDVTTVTKAVGKRVTSLCCEIEGIVLGIESATNYLRERNT